MPRRRSIVDAYPAGRRPLLLSVSTADGTTVSNPGAGVVTTLSLTYTLPANFLDKIGRTLRITLDCTVQGAATNTTRFRLLGGSAGSTVIYDCLAKTNAGTGAAQVRIVWLMTCRAPGSSGTVMVTVPEFFLAAAIASEPAATATVDTTAINVLGVDYTPSVTNANIQCIPKQLTVEALN